jgi:hypothetical protein
LPSQESVKLSQRIEPEPDTLALGNVKANLDPGCVHFQHLHEKIVQRYRDHSKQVLLNDMACGVVSWPQLNYYLKSEEGRNRYGSLTDAHSIRKEWELAGVLETYDEPHRVGHYETVVTLTTAMRARIPNYWSATGKRVNREDYLWAVLVRRRMSDDDDENDDGGGGGGGPSAGGGKKIPKGGGGGSSPLGPSAVGGGDELEDKHANGPDGGETGSRSPSPERKRPKSGDLAPKPTTVTGGAESDEESIFLPGGGDPDAAESQTAGIGLPNFKGNANFRFGSIAGGGGRVRGRPEYYWQIQPLVTPCKTMLPAQVTTGVDGVVGEHWFIGSVTDVFYKGESMLQQTAKAKEAVFPEVEDPEVHRRARTKLFDVEVQLHIR